MVALEERFHKLEGPFPVNRKGFIPFPLIKRNEGVYAVKLARECKFSFWFPRM